MFWCFSTPVENKQHTFTMYALDTSGYNVSLEAIAFDVKGNVCFIK